MPTWICLLRGVNLGARNKLNMAALRKALTEAGLENVRTYLQTGNVITDIPTADATEVADRVGDVLGDRFDLDVPIIVRSPEQLRRLADWCPFAVGTGVVGTGDPSVTRPAGVVHLVHLNERPEPDRVTALLDDDWSPDEVAVDGMDVAIRYATSMHHSRLSHGTALRRLGVDGTARNWRTLQALIKLTAEA